MPGPTRRTLLLGSAAAAFLAACGGDDDAATSTTTTGDGVAPVPSGSADAPVLGATFDRNWLLVAGIPQRAPFLLFEPDGGLVPTTDAPSELVFEITAERGGPLDPVPVARHGDDVDRAYYPLQATFTEIGLHTVRTTVDGTPLETTVNVNEPGTVQENIPVPLPQVGEPLPSVPSPTTADPLGVATICTRETPCPFHEVSLDAALAAGRPVAALWSTPAFCQVAICGPVLDLLIAAAPSHPDLAIVHLEVFPDEAPPTGQPTPSFQQAFGLTYEPVLFVADATGAITTRLDNIYDGPELAAALATAVA